MTISLLSMALQEIGCSARSLTGWQAGIRTDENHGKALVEQVDTDLLRKYLDQDQVVVVAGFQGVTEAGEITTLGRGGSDTSAVVLAAALQADVCGNLYRCDRCIYSGSESSSQSKKMDELAYEEMLELAHLGAGVLHPRSVECAMIHRVPLVVRSSFEDEPGTWLKEAKEMEETLTARGVAHDLQVARIKVLQLPNDGKSQTRLFNLLAEHQINVDMIVQSEHDQEKIDIAFSVSEAEGKEAKRVLEVSKQDLGFEEILYESQSGESFARWSWYDDTTWGCCKDVSNFESSWDSNQNGLHL